jgi:hypothetical protein
MKLPIRRRKMRNKWFLVVVVLAIGSGCSSKESEENARKSVMYDSLQQQSANKQKKLEECMAQTDKDFQRRRNSNWDRIGCEKYGNTPPLDIVVACNQATDLAKQSRVDDEDRCVKLYK